MSALRLVVPRMPPSYVAWKMGRRFASGGGDGVRLMVGDREVVGYGINGRPIYFDRSDFPFPAIRYRTVTPEVCALREKELGDWKTLSIEDKKQLYRHSFCQTFAEFQYFSPDWKLALGLPLWLLAIACGITVFMKTTVYKYTPDTLEEDRQSAQLRRMIHLQMNPVTGVSSQWCYNTNKWK
ncbi:cytochrome c oxidase subunit 4 isoform 1, mitochondrial [Drosophila kikkawai]|uniref:Cytochrome c oxidase subunit 4 n=1 Tax=Drosophila kikkawai TaxID=30033 RepID=A0A6P4J4E9_DROKI|nr:cytochrome c oxidase subunit 4 isoform 1, mitochondrial [Drosophila kikkawai]XP_041630866.1 cytochrome c oxidase subunit 4 isoform 1, mitochondrial [Drosophila kikkawai]